VNRWAGLGGAWPTPEHELLIRAAVREPGEAAAAWERWRGGGDILALDPDGQRLLPLVYRRLMEAGVRDPDLARLKGIYRHWWYCNQVLLRDAAPAVEALHAAGLPTMLLKGAALAPLHYRDIGARPMGDIDILVPRERALEALRVLDEAGWRPGGSMSADLRTLTRVTHGEPLVKSGSTAIDLHWQVLHSPVVEEDFWERSVPLEVSGIVSRTLGPADQVVHVCVHGADGGLTPIRWVVDVLAVLGSAEVDWERVADVGRRQRIAHTLAEALDYLRSVYGGQVPAAALEALREPPASRRERAVHRAATLPATPARVFRTVWDRYRRLAEYQGRRPRLLGFPAYMRTTMGFRNRRHLARVSLARVVRPLRSSR
jgi:hypothetical protein